MALPERVQQLDARIAASLHGALRGLRDEIASRLHESTSAIEETLARLEAGLPTSFVAREDVEPLAREAERAGHATATTALRDGFAAFDRATTQAGLLSSLLVEAGRFASRAAVFLARPGAARGWAAYGFEELDPPLSEVSIAWSEGGAWSRLAEGRGTVALTTAECAALASRLESQVAQEAVLIPLVLADRVAAALYADRLAQAAPLDLPALQSLVYVAGQALELLALRSRPATPTLLDAGQGTGPEVALALWDPGALAAAAAPAPTPAAAPAAEADLAPPPEVELFAEAPAALAAEAPTPFATEVEEAPAPWEETAAELFAAEEPPGPAEAFWEREGEAEPAALAPPFEEAPALSWREPEPPAPAPSPAAAAAPETAWPAAEGEPAWPAAAAAEPAERGPAETYEARFEPEPPAFAEEEPVFEDEEAAPFAEEALPADEPFPPPGRPSVATAEMRIAEVDVSEDATLLLSHRPSPTPPPPPPFLAPPPPPPMAPEEEDETRPGSSGMAAATRAMPRAGASPEVAPPSDFFGPGLAFAGRRAPSGTEDALHEEARRLARLLVSEIRLYNEEQVEEGKRNRDIYARLKEEIDRSRKMYEERIAPEVRATRDYFREELVRRLADGDTGALGM